MTIINAIAAGKPGTWTMWGVMAVSAVGVALYSAPRYLTLDPSLNPVPLDPDFALHLLWLSAHAVPSSLALLIGPFQFLTGFRARYPGWHRNLGRIYLVSVLVGCITAAVSTYASQSGFPAQIGFAILTMLWFYTGLQAYLTARARRFDAHRVWMIRNYALTFGAVLLRVFIGIGEFYREFNPHLTFEDTYTPGVWGSILICVLIPEWFILSRRQTRGTPAPRSSS